MIIIKIVIEKVLVANNANIYIGLNAKLYLNCERKIILVYSFDIIYINLW